MRSSSGSRERNARRNARVAVRRLAAPSFGQLQNRIGLLLCPQACLAQNPETSTSTTRPPTHLSGLAPNAAVPPPDASGALNAPTPAPPCASYAP